MVLLPLPLTSLSLRRLDSLAIFLNVMMHSISSPAYTVGSFQRTYARMFDCEGGGGSIVTSGNIAGPLWWTAALSSAFHGIGAIAAFSRSPIAFGPVYHMS